MKKDLIVAVIMIAIMAGVILMPWQAYYAIAALAGVGVWIVKRDEPSRSAKDPLQTSPSMGRLSEEMN